MTASKRFVLIGHPVSHSVSPAIHAAAYAALGLAHRYELRDCPDASAVEQQVELLRRGEIAGANVTVPHKRLAFELADRRSQSALETGVANVLTLTENGAVEAYNTDALALAEELGELHPEPQRVVVVGAGGAARAAVCACRMLRVREIFVTRRSWHGALSDARMDEWPGASGFVELGAQPLAWAPSHEPLSEGPLFDALCNAELIVQATSAGMHGAAPGEQVSSFIPWSRLSQATGCYDVVYNPALTPFLAEARSAGLAWRGGLGMLVRQAARAVEIWLGQKPPIEPMGRAAATAMRDAANGSSQASAAPIEK